MLGFAAIYRDILPAYRRLILPQKQAENAKSGKMRQIGDVDSSQIVVKTGWFYYCRFLRPKIRTLFQAG